MQFNKRWLFLKLGLLFCAIHLVLYLPIHISYQDFFANSSRGTQIALGIIISVLSELASFLIPLCSAAILFTCYAYKGHLFALTKIPVMSLPYLIQALPENYLNYLMYGDSLFAVFASVVFSILTVITVSLQILVLYCVILFFCRFPKEKRYECREIEDFGKDEAFNFSAPFTKGLFAASLVLFAVKLVSEIITTVTYVIDIKERNASFLAKDILTVALTFVFITLVWVVSYVAAYKCKEHLIYTRLEFEED